MVASSDVSPVSGAPVSYSGPTPAALRPSLYLLSGGIAGLSVDLVLFPLDTIKVRAGITRSGSNSASEGSGS
jgi:hypothetical protein